MRMDVGVRLAVAVTVAVGALRDHGETLYYNITGVHHRPVGSCLAIAVAAGKRGLSRTRLVVRGGVDGRRVSEAGI